MTETKQTQDSTKEKTDLIAALRDVGLEVDDIYDLVNSRRRYKRAIPVLVDFLNRASSPRLKEGIARSLTVREAKGIAGQALVRAFELTEEPAARWAIGNALSVAACESDLSELVRIARDRKFGAAREMVVIALGKFDSRLAVDTLLDLLDDEEVVGHAVAGLGTQKAVESRPRIEQLTKHPTPWVRTEAKRALAKFAKLER